MKKSNLYLTILIVALIAIAPYSMSAQDMVTAVGQEGLEKTVSYDIASFTDIRDKKLEDVLKKMPGITEATWEGPHTYKYNGMDIKKVYVNGLDVLEGNYEPVYNMKPEDVERLEISENHVSEKVMKGMQFSNDAAINVILKEEAASKWSGSVKGGLGLTPLLANADVNAINIGNKMQSTVLFKADNTGLDFSGALKGFGGENFRGGPPPVISGSGTDYSVKKFLNVEPSLAPLAPERVRFNRSAIANIGTTLKLNDDYQVNVQLIYHTDRLTASSLDETTYYLTQGSQVVDVVGENAKSHQHDIQADITLLANTDTKYLRNQLSFATQWNNVDKNISGTFPNDQKTHTTPLLVQDEFLYKRHLGGSILSFDAKAGLYSRPQDLDVEKPEGLFTQAISANSAFAETGVTLDNKLSDHLTLSLNGGVTGNTRQLDVNLKGLNNYTTPDVDSKLQVFNAYGGGKLTFINDKLQAVFEFPLRYGNYDLDDKITGLKESKSKFYIEPNIDMKYEVSPNLSLSLTGRFAQDEVERMNLFPSMVFNDFRMAERGLPAVKSGNHTFAMLNVMYSHPKTSFFVNGSTRYWKDKLVLIPIMDFTDDYIINGYRIGDSNSDGLEGNIDISKGIESLKGKIGIVMHAEVSNQSMVRNESLIPYSSTIYSLQPYINGRLNAWWNVIYQLEFNANRIKMDNEDTSSKAKSYTQTLEMIFSPWQKLNFSILAEHYYTEFMDDVSKHLVLWDAKAEYNLSDQWQLILSAKNILNQKTYNYTLADSQNFTKSYTAYKIRPRNILISLFYKF